MAITLPGDPDIGARLRRADACKANLQAVGGQPCPLLAWPHGALSRDRAPAAQPVDESYGVVCEGAVLDGLIVIMTNQEHGVIAVRPGSGARLPHMPVGTMLRILPNHACATGAQFDGYNVLTTSGGLDHWPRFRGW